MHLDLPSCTVFSLHLSPTTRVTRLRCILFLKILRLGRAPGQICCSPPRLLHAAQVVLQLSTLHGHRKRSRSGRPLEAYSCVVTFTGSRRGAFAIL